MLYNIMQVIEAGPWMDSLHKYEGGRGRTMNRTLLKIFKCGPSIRMPKKSAHIAPEKVSIDSYS